MYKWSIFAVACVLLFSGCTKSGKTYRPSSQELRLNLPSEPPTLDPRKAIDTVSASVINLCFEGLMGRDPSGNIVLGSAEQFTLSEDKTRYTFTLRDTKWSDGTPVTAIDFEKSWKAVLDPTFACMYASDLYIIKNARPAKANLCSSDEIGVRALDEKTLQVDLENPTPYFLEALSTLSFFPTPFHITSVNPHWIEEHYVCNGPFLVKEWKHNNRLLLEKNPQYWDRDKTTLERVTLTILDDVTTELAMYDNGELDWAGNPLSPLPSEALPFLEKTGKLQNFPISATYFYVFNTKEFPFNNVNIRKAFSLAINRQAIVDNVTHVRQMPAMSLIPPTIWKDAKGYFKDNDLEEAKRLFQLGLKQLGITAKELPPIRLSYNTMVDHHKIAQAIQEQWHKAFGVKVQLENKEWKVFLDELSHHKFHVARMGGVANVNDPATFLDYYRFLSSANNLPQWSNPKYTKALEEADRTTDESKRTALLKEAEKILMDDMPIAPIYFYKGVYLKKPYVKGIHLTELNHLDLKWAYIDINDTVSR